MSNEINLRDLMDSCHYFRNDTTKTAFKVAAQLEEWCNKFNLEPDIRPTPRLEITPVWLSICVDDFTLWHSECDSEEDLCAEYCIDTYKSLTFAAATWPDEPEETN